MLPLLGAGSLTLGEARHHLGIIAVAEFGDPLLFLRTERKLSNSLDPPQHGERHRAAGLQRGRGVLRARPHNVSVDEQPLHIQQPTVKSVIIDSRAAATAGAVDQQLLQGRARVREQGH